MSDSGGIGPNPQLHVELVADDMTGKTLEAVRKGFEQLAQSQQQALSKPVEEAPKRASLAFNAFGGVMMALGADVYGRIKEIGHAIPELIEEATHAALEETQAIRELSNTFSLLGDGKATFDQLTEAASIYHDELEAAGLAGYTSSDALNAAFTELLYTSEKTTEQVEQLVIKMGEASRIVPGGIDAMTQGMRMFEFGMYRAKNPLVQLIAATDVMHGNAKQVAAQLQKMTPEEAMKKAELAIERMSAKAKELPPSFKELKQNIDDIKSDALETFGHQVEEQLMPLFTDMVAWLRNNKQSNEDMIEELGRMTGEGAREVLETVRDGLKDLAKYSDDFKKSWEQIATIMQATLGPMKVLLMGIPDALGTISKVQNKVFDTIVEQGAKVLPAGYNANAGLYSVEEVQKQRKAQEALAGYGASPRDISIDDFAKLRSNLLKSTLDVGGSVEDVDRRMQSAARAHEAERVIGRQLEESAGVGSAGVNAEVFAHAFDVAAAVHDKAALEYAADLISGSKGLQDAFLSSKQTLEGGYRPLIDLVRDKNAEFAKALAGLAKAPAARGTNPVMNFYGGVHIKQDFRDNADPDRIVLRMRRDLVQEAEHRRESRLSTLFGL